MFSIMEYVTAHRRAPLGRAPRAARPTPGAPLFAGRSIMLIDEAWHLVGRPETGEYANDLARRARHLGLVLIVMSQQLSDFDTEHGLALLQNSTMQLLLAQHPNEIPFIRDALRLSEEEARLVGRLKTVKGSHAQMLWINGTRGRGRVALRVGADRVLGLHLRPGRRRAAARRHARRARRRRVGGDRATSPATAARPRAGRRRERERRRDDRCGRRRRPPGRDARAPREAAATRATRRAGGGGRRCWRCAALCGGAGASTLELPARALRRRRARRARARLRHRRPDRRAGRLRRRASRRARCSRPPSTSPRGLPLAGGVYAVDADAGRPSASCA